LKYGVHPSEELVRLFSKKPYQGENPADAQILIIGNDANYSPEISEHKEYFKKILDYHSDGVSFWKKTGKHHPFLLNDYPFDRRKGGVRYHLNFSKMGFGPEDAECFSFIELLNVPTIGNTGSNKELFFDMLDESHLRWLESLILRGDKKFVLINQTLAKSISKISKRFGVLGDLASILDGKSAPAVVLESPNVVLYNGFSFSHSVSNEYLRQLAMQMRAFIKDGRAHC
jgi:hypothetical protein